MSYREWLADVCFHLRHGPVIVNKYTLRSATDAPDTRNACLVLSEALHRKVNFIFPDLAGDRVLLI